MERVDFEKEQVAIQKFLKDIAEGYARVQLNIYGEFVISFYPSEHKSKAENARHIVKTNNPFMPCAVIKADFLKNIEW